MMSVATAIDEQWVDIVSPGLPSVTGEPVTIIVIGLMFALLLGLGAIYYSRPRQQAKRALRRLAHDLQPSPTHIKSTCFQIAQCLRQAFAQNRLHAVQFAPAKQVQWQDYLMTLTRFCFAPELPSITEVNNLIQETRRWINTKVVHG